MKQTKIHKFVHIEHPITYSNERIEITFKDGISLIGYFDKQILELNNQNQWSFVEAYQENNQKEISTLNGDDFKSINLHRFNSLNPAESVNPLYQSQARISNK